MSYRPGKRLGPWAQRAGSGDIIGWTGTDAPPPVVAKASPSAASLGLGLAPAPALVPADAVVQGGARQGFYSAHYGITTDMPAVAPSTSPLVSPVRQYDVPVTYPPPADAASPGTPRLARDAAAAAAAAMSSRHDNASAAAALRAVNSTNSYTSSPVSPQPALPYDRPGTPGHAQAYSLHQMYDAVSALPSRSPPAAAPALSPPASSVTSPQDQAAPYSYPPAPPGPAASVAWEAAAAQVYGGRQDFLRVLAGRQVEVGVVRHLWQSEGSEAALSHLGRLHNSAVAVDVLRVLSGVGLPRWPACKSLDWLVELAPLLTALLQSQYEDYLLVGLGAVGSVLSCLQPLHTAAGAEAPSQTLVDLAAMSRHCLLQLDAGLRALERVEGRVGRLAKARHTGVNALLEPL